MGDDSDDGSSQGWGSALISGLSGVVDSQLANQFGVNTPQPSTQYGTQGQSATPVVAAAASPMVWIALAGAVVLLVVLIAKK
jgi:hypothetical protein